MKNTYLLFFSLFLAAQVSAQPGPPHRDYKKIEAYKTKFLTQELDLSTEEAQRFWPIYNEYNEKLQALFRAPAEGLSHRQIRDDWDELSDEQLERITLHELENQRKIADLKISYYQKFKVALGTKKAATFFRVEMEFRRHLVEMLGKRRRRQR